MKVAIFAIFALCAFVAQGSQSVDDNNKLEDTSFVALDGLIDGLQEFIQKVQEEIKKIVENLREKTKKIIDEIEDQVRVLEEKAKAAVNKSLDDLNDLLGKMEEAGDIPLKCIEEHHEEIDSITKNSLLQVENCVSDAIEKGQGILNNIQEHIDGIQDNLNKMDSVIQECRETNKGAAKVALCVTKRATEVQKEVFGILKHATDALINANKQTVSIVVGAEVCLAKTVVDVNKQIYNVTASINKCILNGGE